MKSFLFCNQERLKDIGLLIIRVGIGCIFLKHGWGKLNGGVAQWVWIGGAMNLVGISFGHMYWGCAVAVTEFVGGLCLISGFLMRFAVLCMAIVMGMATLTHYTNGDPWLTLSYPLSLLFV